MPNDESAHELVIERATAEPAGDGAERVRIATSRGATACRYHDARVTVREVDTAEVETLFPVLLQAEPSERALRWSVRHLSEKVYRMDVGGAGGESVLAGAATVRWAGDPCEIVELAVAEALHGRGLGRQLVAWIVGEAARRGKRAVEVGTANASIGNLAFYQKCGFRFAHVRRDYFSYYREPRVEHGIAVRDLVVFRYELAPGDRGRRGDRA